jgi:hypothetical protein
MPSTALITAAVSKPATNQRNTSSSIAARRPTATINHTHMREAASPAVNARSSTCGTQSNEVISHANNAALTTRSITVHRGLASGNSTTASKAHAAIIQLTNKGMTAVDGLLANGLSHGKATHKTRMMLRTKRFCAVDEFMV